LKSLRKSFDDVKRKIPGELLQGEDGIRLDDVDWLKGILDDVEKLAIGRLLSQEEAS
jgi:hypothetical protein